MKRERDGNKAHLTFNLEHICSSWLCVPRDAVCTLGCDHRKRWGFYLVLVFIFGFFFPKKRLKLLEELSLPLAAVSCTALWPLVCVDALNSLRLLHSLKENSCIKQDICMLGKPNIQFLKASVLTKWNHKPYPIPLPP